MSESEKQAKVIELEVREVDPLDAWLVKARDKARKVAKVVDAAGKVGHALADFVEKIRVK